MKKTILMLLLAIMGAKVSMAQTDLVATLSHSSSISTYYGVNALSEAYSAAVDGDVITLSSGTFNAVDIKKAITLRGARCLADPVSLIEPTFLTGYYTINIPSGDVQFSIEDISSLKMVSIRGNNLKTINIIRCYFESIVLDGCQAIFIHSIIRNDLALSTYLSNYSNGFTQWTYNNTQAKFINCVVHNPSESSYATASTCEFNHCIILQNNSYNLRHPVINNSIIAYGKDLKLPEASSVSYSISTGNGGAVFDNFPNGNNQYVADMSTIFKTLSGYSFDRNETFELTETAAATYLGDDGKQVGIYGGTNPFDPTPTNPQIKKFTVDNSVNNGKLSVKINVE